ncbi:YitT family protein [Spongiactinospora sp. TRM90649]|uniref:YczE/YyaS/YitT family protein n=1 Tax=Spongiactinospora sp. TRM90649 TaxID=3031114 RepID=UPI0023F822F1|nr:YitT family protein [Spongiactinospora sp. TRM90649]MDF5758316.1 YitT family protein [Spongiactinospora sp. TRM90649]
MNRVSWNGSTVRDAASRNIAVRLAMVVVGLALNGVGIAMLIQAGLGLGAWDVLHEGLSELTGLSFGLVVILVTIVALIPWWPLKERPGIGTVLNVFIAGIVIDWILAYTTPAEEWWVRATLMIGGVVIFALGQGMYLAPKLGAGAREGLMTGINRRFGISIRLTRFLIEVTILVLGVFLGGSVGLGTIVFTLAIGPLVQVGMNLFGYREETETQDGAARAEA